MKPDIIIPTCKSRESISPMICDLETHLGGNTVIPTCQKVCAAKNRNIGLEAATSDIVIMIDDDISGFYDGWDKELIKPLLENDDISYVSAHLVQENGMDAAMMFHGNDNEYLTEVPRMPTACVAFRNDGLRFHEEYIGSGFEDDDFCVQLYERYPESRMVINNRVRMVHANEKKNQVNNNKINSCIFKKRFNGNRSGRYHGIPTIMHFIWIGSKLPSWARKNINEFQKLNPNFKTMVHTGGFEYKSLVKHIDGDHKFERMCDVFRVEVLRKYGGWYFDCDFWPLRPIEDICKDYDLSCGCFLTSAGVNLIANGIIGTRRNSPAIEQYHNAILIELEFGPKDNGIDRWGQYGPGKLTELNYGSNFGKHIVLGKSDMFYPIDDKEFVRQYNKHKKFSEFELSGNPYMFHFHNQGKVEL